MDLKQKIVTGLAVALLALIAVILSALVGAALVVA